MMDATFEATLIASLDALDRGEPVEDILRHYPAHAAELRPILFTAGGLSDLDLAPTRTAEAGSRERFLARAAQSAAETRTPQSTVNQATAAQVGATQTRIAQSKTSRPSPSRAPQSPGRFAWLGRPALTMAAMAVAVVMMIVISISASASALPGDRLYTLKRATERIQVALVADGASQTALHDAFNQRRIDEAKALVAAGREGDVDFLGVAEPAGEGSWRIAGVLAQVDDSTQIMGDLGPGELVHVRGRVSGGRVLLGTVVCLDDAPNWMPGSGPPPAMTAIPWPTPLPAATQRPVASPASTQPPIATPESSIDPGPAAPPAGSAGAGTGAGATRDDDDGVEPGDGDDDGNDDDSGKDDDDEDHGSGKDDEDKGKDEDDDGSGKDDGGKGKDDGD